MTTTCENYQLWWNSITSQYEEIQIVGSDAYSGQQVQYINKGDYSGGSIMSVGAESMGIQNVPTFPPSRTVCVSQGFTSGEAVTGLFLLIILTVLLFDVVFNRLAGVKIAESLSRKFQGNNSKDGKETIEY